MTILTKPSNEKNNEKIPLPLADDVAILHGGVSPGNLLTAQQRRSMSDIDTESMVFNRQPHYTCVKSCLLFLIALTMMTLGIAGSYIIYRFYMPSQAWLHYRALCDIPYNAAALQGGSGMNQTHFNQTLPRFYMRQNDFDMFLPHFGEDPINDLVDDNFFREEIELDMTDDESYAKIDVPDFKDGRRGRFMHDFKENQSAIIDTTANRCFIMTLDRDTTLPPKNFMDLMQKMGSGYYNIDTDRVRRHMRVVTPPITDLSLISERIANECYDMKVYMLENYVSGVFKREAKPITESGKFAEFLGKGVVEFDIVNIADIEEYERQHQQK